MTAYCADCAPATKKRRVISDDGTAYAAAETLAHRPELHDLAGGAGAFLTAAAVMHV